MSNGRPELFLVREKFIEGAPFKGLIFGVFRARKVAKQAQKAATSGPHPACDVAEIVELHQNYIYETGITSDER